jgi:hypothetical protein
VDRRSRAGHRWDRDGARGQLVLSIVLIAVGLLVGPGGVSMFA